MSKKPSSRRAQRRAAEGGRDTVRAAAPPARYIPARGTPVPLTRAARDAAPKRMSKRNLRAMQTLIGGLSWRRAMRDAEAAEKAEKAAGADTG